MRTNAVTIGAVTLALAAVAAGGVGGLNGYTADVYYANPHAGESLVSFDWAGGDLYYGTGIPNYGLGFKVYSYDGAGSSAVHSDAGVFAGSRVTEIDGQVYFNDGGDYGRTTFDYFRHDPSGGPVVRIIDSIADSVDLWGLNSRNGQDFWAVGSSSSAISQSDLDANGDPVGLTAIGQAGGYSGPMAFDGDGNLYYANSYSTEPRIYRWTAAEVDAAVADPAGSPLESTGHVWADIAGPQTGATGMAVGEDGDVYVTVTAFASPSELRRYFVDETGANDGVVIAATSDARLETVRAREGLIYFSAADGIYSVPEPATLGLLAIGAFAAIRKMK